MEGAFVAIVVGLVVAFVGFIGRQLLLPAIRSLAAWIRRPRACRRLLDAARGELGVNIERLASASLASREVEEDGTERVFYRFGSAYSGLPVPSLPTLRRSALDALHTFGRRCLGDSAGLVDDALACLERFEGIDRDRFAEAWHGAMNPVMERMVIGDPGHRINRASAKVVMDTDKLMTATRDGLDALRCAIEAQSGQLGHQLEPADRIGQQGRRDAATGAVRRPSR